MIKSGSHLLICIRATQQYSLCYSAAQCPVGVCAGDGEELHEAADSGEVPDTEDRHEQGRGQLPLQ